MIINKKFLRDVPINDNVVNKSLQSRDINIQKYDIFISHSFKDKLLIEKLIKLFKLDGINVYVDWIENPELNRKRVTNKTVNIIRESMKNCKSLAYVSTEYSTDSKWCPWELGYGDGYHKGKVCILPILNSEETTFKGQEYLGIYPYIDYVKSDEGRYHFYVNDPNNNDNYCILKEWINGGSLKNN